MFPKCSHLYEKHDQVVKANLLLFSLSSLAAVNDKFLDVIQTVFQILLWFNFGCCVICLAIKTFVFYQTIMQSN